MSEILGKIFRIQHPEVENAIERAELSRLAATARCAKCLSKLEPTGNLQGVLWQCPSCKKAWMGLP